MPTPTLAARLARHADLIDGMARSLGLDPASILRTGHETGARQLRSAVMACTTCGDPDGCALHVTSDRAGTLPSWCRGPAHFDRLTPLGD